MAHHTTASGESVRSITAGTAPSRPHSPVPGTASASSGTITDGQREVLETLLRSHTAPVRQVRRAQVLLMAAEGVSNVEIAERCDVSRPTVLAWRKQFEAEGLTRFGEVTKGRGPKPSIPEEKIAYTWRYKGEPGDSLVTFELAPEGDNTRLKLTHTGIETFPRTPAYARKNFEAGWTAIIGSELQQFDESSKAKPWRRKLQKRRHSKLYDSSMYRPIAFMMRGPIRRN